MGAIFEQERISPCRASHPNYFRRQDIFKALFVILASCLPRPCQLSVTVRLTPATCLFLLFFPSLLASSPSEQQTPIWTMANFSKATPGIEAAANRLNVCMNVRRWTVLLFCSQVGWIWLRSLFFGARFFLQPYGIAIAAVKADPSKQTLGCFSEEEQEKLTFPPASLTAGDEDLEPFSQPYMEYVQYF